MFKITTEDNNLLVGSYLLIDKKTQNTIIIEDKIENSKDIENIKKGEKKEKGK